MALPTPTQENESRRRPSQFGLAAVIVTSSLLAAFIAFVARSQQYDSTLLASPVVGSREALEEVSPISAQRGLLSTLSTIAPADENMPADSSANVLDSQTRILYQAMVLAYSEYLLAEMAAYVQLTDPQKQAIRDLFVNHAPGLPGEAELAAIVGIDAASQFVIDWNQQAGEAQKLDYRHRIARIEAIYAQNTPLMKEDVAKIHEAVDRALLQHGARYLRIEQKLARRSLLAHLQQLPGTRSFENELQTVQSISDEFKTAVREHLNENLLTLFGEGNSHFTIHIAKLLAGDMSDADTSSDDGGHEESEESPIDRDSHQWEVEIDTDVLYYSDLLRLTVDQQQAIRRVLAAFNGPERWSQLLQQQIRLLTTPGADAASIMGLAASLREEETAYVREQFRVILTDAQFNELLHVQEADYLRHLSEYVS